MGSGVSGLPVHAHGHQGCPGRRRCPCPPAVRGLGSGSGRPRHAWSRSPAPASRVARARFCRRRGAAVLIPDDEVGFGAPSPGGPGPHPGRSRRPAWSGSWRARCRGREYCSRSGAWAILPAPAIPYSRTSRKWLPFQPEAAASRSPSPSRSPQHDVVCIGHPLGEDDPLPESTVLGRPVIPEPEQVAVQVLDDDHVQIPVGVDVPPGHGVPAARDRPSG